MTEAMKYDGEKVRLDLLPADPIIDVGKVLTYGARKYNPENWRKGLAWSRCYGAALRHLLAWHKGETNDPETGLNHLAHAACEILFLLEFSRTHPELDDRPQNGEKPLTLLDVVNRNGFDKVDLTPYCPWADDLSAAFARGGYKRPDKICPCDESTSTISCVDCWNRPTKKLEPVQLKAQPDPEQKSWIDCVKEFNKAYSVPVWGTADCMSEYEDAIEEQIDLINEECDELFIAYDNWKTLHIRENEVVILDAICDSIYVLIGLALKMGMNLDGAFREVHRSNMSKLGPDGKPIKRADGKVLKGPNYTPPKLEAFI